MADEPSPAPETTTSATTPPAAASEPSAPAPQNQDAAAPDLLCLRLFTPAEVPPHPALSNSGSSSISASAFTSALLAQGLAFATSTLPSRFTRKSAAKKSPGSASAVEVLVWERPPGDSGSGGPETWFARRSRHADAAERGTASWSEFDDGLRARHSEHEMEYTPNVVEAHRVCGWEDVAADGWEAVGLEVYEMAHKMPPPLQNRFFPVLVATARRAGAADNDSRALLVVQVPIDISKSEAAKYSSGKVKSVVRGIYASVEHVRVEPDGQILWEMATASDAKGVLPMPVQKLGVPGAIVKDVGLFLGWVQKNREKQ